jgi:hypothetical protein
MSKHATIMFIPFDTAFANLYGHRRSIVDIPAIEPFDVPKRKMGTIAAGFVKVLGIPYSPAIAHAAAIIDNVCSLDVITHVAPFTGHGSVPGCDGTVPIGLCLLNGQEFGNPFL